MVHCRVHLVRHDQFTGNFKIYLDFLRDGLRLERIQDDFESLIWIEDLVCQDKYTIFKLAQINQVLNE